MDKTIVIGLGGTGLDAIRSLRKLIVENYGSLDAEAVRNLGFLYIDTDPAGIVINRDNKWKWEVLGKSTALSPSEYKIISAPDIATVIKDIDAYPQIRDWLPLDDLESINKSAKDTPGASQIRPLGRFILTMACNEIESSFKNVFNRVPQAPGGGDTHIYLICSLSGGTGSGMFLDLAYLVHEWTAGNCKVYGFLVFPELTTNRGLRYTVNAYAALLELNYFSNSGSVMHVGGQDKTIHYSLPGKPENIKRTPFDHSYVVSPRNNAGVELDLSAIPSMIAHRIFLNFDSSFSSAADTLLNNGKMERAAILRDSFNGNLHSRNFYTFGLSSIQYPIDQFLDIFSFKLSKAVIDLWARAKDFPGDINARVQGYLPLLKLTDDYLLGDKDFFGSRHFDNFEVEVENIVNGLKQTHPQNNIAPYLAKQFEIKENEFRGVGVQKFYQNKKDDLKGAIREVQKLVRKRISLDLVDSELGYDYCEKMLEEMTRIFREKHKAFVDRFNGLPAREKNSRAAMGGFFNELTKNEGKLWFKDKALKDSMTKIGDSMKVNFGARIALKAYEFAIAFISGLLETLEAEKANLKNWRDAVEKMRNELENEINKRVASVLRKIENVKEFNGSLLFSETKIEENYASMDTAAALAYIERKILQQLQNGVLDLPSSNYDVEDFYHAALEWLLEQSVLRISDTNVTDKLKEDYPDEIDRMNLISQNYNKSYPFLTMDSSEISKGFEGDNYSLNSGTTNARLVGILKPEKDKSTSVGEVIQSIKKATADVKIEWISDRHQILFLQEYTAFPLRVIRELKTLKEQYEQYQKSSTKPLPIHITKSFDPPLIDLFLTSDEQKREVQKAEENFVLARALGRIKVEENPMQGRQEIRFRYMELGSEKVLVLGNSWEGAFDSFLKASDEMKRSRDLLNKDLSALLKSYDTKAKRDELWFALDNFMAELRKSLEYGDENPTYKRYNDIRTRVVRACGLYDEGNPPIKRVPKDEATEGTARKPGGPLKPESAPNEEKYRNMVRTTMKKTNNGALSPAMEAMLKRNQVSAGMTDERATAIRQEVKAEMFGSPKLTEYQEMFEVFYSGKEISEDERCLLIEKQVELDLTDEQVAEIEATIMRKEG
jgi:hypothetical protein